MDSYLTNSHDIIEEKAQEIEGWSQVCSTIEANKSTILPATDISDTKMGALLPEDDI